MEKNILCNQCSGDDEKVPQITRFKTNSDAIDRD